MRLAPRIPSLLLRMLLPREAGEVIAGDLEEQWTTADMSAARYWRLAAASVVACWVDRIRRHDSAAPYFVRQEGDRPMRSFLRDLHYGVRLLRRSPGFTAAALITLAIGIGANTAVFSLVNVQTLQPLPYRDPARLAFVQRLDLERNTRGFALSLAEFVDVRDARLFADVAAYAYWSANLTGGDQPERVQAYRVTANTFDLLGVPPLLGRGFTSDDGQAGARDVVVMTHALWQRRFGGDQAIVGRDVFVDGRPHTIVGIMPRGFEYPIFNFKGDLYAPLRFDEAELAARRGTAPTVPVVARLRPDMSYADTQANLSAVMRRLEKDHPDTNRAMGARIIAMGSLDDELMGPAIPIVLVTVAAVLLLACANVANLLLARGVSRRRELAVRAALGAARGRIARQLLAETTVVAVGGGALGAAFAWVALHAIRASLPEIITATMPNLDALGLDGLTLAFTMGISLATAALSGLLPALRASRPRLQDGLGELGSAGGSRDTRRLRSALVVAEVALSTTLLIVAGLLVRSYQQVTSVSPGFNPDSVLTLALSLPDYKYADPASRRQFFERLVADVSRLGSVRSAAVVNVLPFSTYNRGTRFQIDGAPEPLPGRDPSTDYRIISPGYFQTMQIPLIAGRALDARDRPAGAGAVIVNQALVRRYFEGHSPVGRRIRFGAIDSDDPWLEIVGVVGNVQHEHLTADFRPEAYVPLAQSSPAMMMLAARTSTDPLSLVPSVRSAIASIDPAQPIYHVKALQTMVEESLAPQTASAALVSIFSLVALVLATVGIYGVVSYAVSQQTREFGIRLALGARPADLMRAVLAAGFRLLAVGLIVGTGASLILTRLIAGVLYGVGPYDPATYAAVVVALAVVGLAACGAPAWHATRIAPVTALRVE